MEQVAKCKSLVAIFRDDKKMLDGPHAVGFDIEKDKAFHIDVEQCGIRKISITSDVDVSVFGVDSQFVLRSYATCKQLSAKSSLPEATISSLLYPFLTTHRHPSVSLSRSE